MKYKGLAQGPVRIGESPHFYFPHLKLGQGYSGCIFQGFNQTNKQKTAVKVMKDGESIRKFIKSQTLIQITNSSLQNYKQKSNGLVEVVQVLSQKRQYIIMNLCKQSLRSFLNKNGKQFNQEFLLSFTLQIVSGLILLKNHGFIYRDLKPQNILFDKQDGFRIGDLDSIIPIDNQNSQFTVQIFGTIEYMAPEVLQMGFYSQKGTIWSLGMILHELIYRQLPTNNMKTQGQNIIKVYNNLFDLQINKSKRSKLPLIHKLMESMLYLNENKRIDLCSIVQTIRTKNIQNNNQKVLSPSSKQNLNDFDSTQSSISQTSEQQKHSKNSIETGNVNNKQKILLNNFLSIVKANIQNMQTPLMKKKSEKLLRSIIDCQITLIESSKDKQQADISKFLASLKQQAMTFIVFLKKLTQHAKSQNQIQLYRRELVLLKMLQTLKRVIEKTGQEKSQKSINDIIQDCLFFAQNKTRN